MEDIKAEEPGPTNYDIPQNLIKKTFNKYEAFIEKNKRFPTPKK